MLVSYVLKPVLGEGFACRMEPYFGQIIQYLSELIKSKKLNLAGNKGDYGELIAAIALSKAYDCLQRDSKDHFSRPVIAKDIVVIPDFGRQQYPRR